MGCFDFLIYASFSTDHKKKESAVEFFEKLLERKEIHAEEIGYLYNYLYLCYNYLCCFDFLIYASFSTDHKKQELAVELFEVIGKKRNTC